MDDPVHNLHNVLIVDDDPDILMLARLGIETVHQDINVRTASSGPDALVQISQQQPDIVVLDLMMPDMDGTETLNKIRQLPAGNQVPVVFLTAKGPAHQSWLEQSDCVAVLSKPFSPLAFGDRLKQVWEDAQQPAAGA